MDLAAVRRRLEEALAELETLDQVAEADRAPVELDHGRRGRRRRRPVTRSCSHA